MNFEIAFYLTLPFSAILLFLSLFFRSQKNKNEKLVKEIVYSIQSTSNISTVSNYQERTFETNLKNMIIISDMDDNRSFNILK